MILDVCPVCGAECIRITFTSSPNKKRYQCAKCGWKLVEMEEIPAVPWVTDKYEIPENCRFCSNHPSNGGTGICHCILGSPGIKC